MKNFSLGLILVLFAVVPAMAQRTVSGTVTDQNGDPLIGATVLLKNTSTGTVTDIDGTYSLEIPEGEQTLVFSYTGFGTQEVITTASNIIDVVLEQGIQLAEAVVTALGIEREKKALGYSVQQVNGEEINSVGDQNITSALSGKVAGVQVISASGASLGGSAKIRIRGVTTLSGASPLFVVDGTPISNANFSSEHRGFDWGNLAQDINPADIESVSVLKGPAATAIYGQRGANGVIMVTTKKGGPRQGIGVTYNGNFTAERVYVLPEYQNEYGGGYSQDFIQYEDPVDGQTYNGLTYYGDESWGPKMDGTMYRPWWSWFPGEDYGKQIPMLPQPDNVRDFYNTGRTLQNNIALSGGNETTSFRLSYTNTDQTGVIPNSSLKRNNVSINASTELTDRLTLSANINISTTKGKGRPKFGYSDDNVAWGFNQWFQRQLNIDRLRDYKTLDGTDKSWNILGPTDLTPLYWDNPFWSVYENYSTDSRDRYFGNVGLSYEILEGLTVSGYLRRDNWTQRIEQRVASGGLNTDSYTESVRNGREDNYEIIGTYNENFGNLSLDANVGGNIRRNMYHRNSMATAGGLNAPNLFNIAASTDRPSVSSFIAEKTVRSVYGGATVGWKSMLYLGFTLRNDWSSALPQDNNSYLYPSAQTSFVFSELMTSNFLSFGKIRASYAQLGSDIADFSNNFNPYQISFAYSAGTPYGSVPTFNLPSTLPNEDLKPTLSSAYEAGLELKFFRNRIGLDLTLYRTDADDQILTLAVPGSSGYSQAIINAGRIRSEGVELALNAVPVQSSNITWNLLFNIATNESKVIELAEGLDNRQLDAPIRWAPTINAPVGGVWGLMRGNAFTYIDDQRVIDEDGSYVVNRNQDLGGILPDWTGGVRNTLDIYGFTVSAFVDFQIGGQFHSTTRMFNAYSGLGLETAGTNDLGNPVRDPVSEGGGVKVEGVLEDGTPHSVYVDAQDYYYGLFDLHELWIYDASFVKLRELSVGYNLPQRTLANTPLQSLRISLVGRNLWLIHSNVDGLDPSEISPGSSNYISHEDGQLPGVRSLGLSLRASF
jgi:TonB-linked SusC/RagA family outer membrane protein